MATKRAAMPVVRVDELLVQAASRGELEHVRSLLDHGALVDARSQHMCTALHWAVTLGHVEVAALLIARGAQIGAKAADGNTPLHIAAREEDVAMVEFLLSAGADPAACDGRGRTALDVALEWAGEEPRIAHALRRALAVSGARIAAAPAAVADAPRAAISHATPTAGAHEGPSAARELEQALRGGGGGLEDLMHTLVGQLGEAGIDAAGGAVGTGEGAARNGATAPGHDVGCGPD